MEHKEKRLYAIIVNGQQVETFNTYGQAVSYYDFICKASEKQVKQKILLIQYSFRNEFVLDEHRNYDKRDDYVGIDSSLQICRMWDKQTNKFTYVLYSYPIKRVNLYLEKEHLTTKLDKENDFEMRECWCINLFGEVSYYPYDRYYFTPLLSTDRQTTLSCRNS